MVYVDKDPVVLAHAHALLTSGPGGVTDYIDADLHATAAILDQAARTLDFTLPVAMMTPLNVQLRKDLASYGGVGRRPG